MRFLPNEHTAITGALRRHGVDTTSVLFVKRRGWLHVELPGRVDTFAFFRKKSTTLDANGRWQDLTNYFIGNSKAEGLGSTWEDVLAAFERWLKV